MPPLTEFRRLDRDGLEALLRQDLLGIEPGELWARGKPLAQAEGRGGAAVLELRDGLRGVLRDYRRGGALSFLLPRSYLDPHRPQRELQLLVEMRDAGVPVVEPLAALARRRLLIFYRLRLITRLVEGASPLPRFIERFPQHRSAAVQAAGRTVGAAFRAGLLHRDLHPDNLIARLHDGLVEVYLLDLDRAERQPGLPAPMTDRMLLRMARYIHKHAGRWRVEMTRGDQWRFLRSLGWTPRQVRDGIRRLAPALEAELRRHGIPAATG